jgi:phosphatidylserine/phosphatidylglycerophosphate/cardiolipin synthase-like enzyme
MKRSAVTAGDTPSGVAHALERFDAVLGDAVERAVRVHHRRRLRRVGWLSALDAPASFVAPHAFSPQEGNRVEVLVDGAVALPRIAAAIRAAEHSVDLAGWFFSPDFELTRGPERHVLSGLLRETAGRGVDVRLLAWAGAPLPLFRPGRRQVEDVMTELSDGVRLRLATDRRERPMHCHHEKLVIVDGRQAFVGGIDLTDLDGDRFDSGRHPIRNGTGWHDATMLVEGPVVADVAHHFGMRWWEVTGERLPTPDPPEPAGDFTVQVARTVPERVYGSLQLGDFSILEAYVGALRAARTLVYLENQFLWSSEIVEILADLLRRPPSDEFRMVVVLPAHPSTGADDTRGQLAVLSDADVDRRLLCCTLVARGNGATEAVYVHAKIGIVDDRWLTLGSANLNEHSLFNDTEVNLLVDDPALAAPTRRRLWAEHLELPLEAVAGDPTTLVDDVWRPTATEQLARRRAGAPATHRLLLLPGVSRRARRLLGPIQSLLVDG